VGVLKCKPILKNSILDSVIQHTAIGLQLKLQLQQKKVKIRCVKITMIVLQYHQKHQIHNLVLLLCLEEFIKSHFTQEKQKKRGLTHLKPLNSTLVLRNLTQ
jgi:hypothetical protein